MAGWLTGVNMTNIEKLQSYIVDLETVLQHRDGFLRQIRSLDLEMELVGNNTLDKFKNDTSEYLSSLHSQLLQADEYLRASQRKLTELSGKQSPEEARVLITELKVALNKIAESNTRLASAKADFAVYENSENEEIRNVVTRELADATADLEKYESYAFSLIPESYNP